LADGEGSGYDGGYGQYGDGRHARPRGADRTAVLANLL
jgi:hypothetical protein